MRCKGLRCKTFWVPPKNGVLNFNIDGSTKEEMQCYKLLVESDSTNVVKWISKPNSVPWRLKWIINKIENLKPGIPNWSVKHTLCKANDIADSLVKAGVNRGDDYILVLDSE
ncbi:hypothetical protein PTKIN_Ptkin11bG0157200 [Pterospermum kingtungense]